ncbi:hypothetical protein [Zavarzinella formosa]|uniref:hypothetical protein n=1 Tax=Zavarzinella formosa TaxID=360055 RepID=UPI0002E823D2|nr:hypothetical protein [Zavarzinella formosa]
MASFKDGKNREWTVLINVPVIKRVLTKTGKNLGDLLKNECALLMEITASPVLFADVLASMCGPQIAASGITEEDFQESLAGDAGEPAVQAFWDALVDFSPPRTRETLRSLGVKSEQVRQLAMTRAGESLAKFMEMTPEKILNTISSNIATGSPESSASNPGI